MKIIHTSDWHLGQEFYGYDRTEEHNAFLEQLKEMVYKEQPDVMVVSGDIYHNTTPSNSIMRLFTDRLDALREACPQMQIIITAGNHDSPSRLEISRTLWSHLGVEIIGRIEKKEGHIDFSRHIIAIKDKNDRLCGYVVALPHLFPQSYPSISEENLPAEERMKAFYKALEQQIIKTNRTRLPVVMMAHLAIKGSDITGHDETRGGMEYMNIEDLGQGFDYLALGHIHCPQTMDQGRARYSGSPIPVSFDENYVHSVTVVELQHGGEKPAIRIIPVRNPWPLKTVPEIAVSFEEAIQQLSSIPAELKSYIRLHVLLEDVAPRNAMERAGQAVENKFCRFCCFKWEHKEPARTDLPPFEDVEQIKAESPIEIADMYYRNRFGNPMSCEYRNMLEEVMEVIRKKTE